MKKLMSSILCITMLLTMFSGTAVFATEDIDDSLADETTVEETIEETATDEEILLDGDYEITTIGDSYYAFDMEYRDVEIFITDGVNPIADAAVTLNGVTVCTDDSGIAEFDYVPTSFDEYIVSVSSSFGEKETVLLVSSSEKIEDLDNIDLTVKDVISYWTPGTVVSSDSGTASAASFIENEVDDEWTYWFFSDLTTIKNAYMIDEYLYVYGNGLIAYDVTNKKEYYLTTPSTDSIVECNGELYGYYAAYNSAGGSDNYYSAYWKMYKYDTSSNEWNLYTSNTSGGIFDCEWYSDGERLISIGGDEVVYDSDTPSYYQYINIYDTTTKTHTSQYLGTEVQDTYELDNKLYSYHSDEKLTIIDLDSYDSSTGQYTIETIENMTDFYSEGQSAVYNDGKIYLIGGATSSYGRIYDCETKTVSYSSNAPVVSGKTWSVAYNNCIYIVTYGYLYVYNLNTKTMTKSSSPEFDDEYDMAKIILDDNTIYCLWEDAIIGLYEIDTTGEDNDTIASGKYHTLKIVDGEVYACGNNTSGQLGVYSYEAVQITE